MGLQLKKSITPFEHQLEGIDFATKHRYSLNAFDAGLGKTLVAIALANKLQAPCLVVCPAYLKYNWLKEINNLCADSKSVSLYKKKAEVSAHQGSEFMDDFVIINYEQLDEAEHLFKWAELVVYDECHMLQSVTANRTILTEEYIFENKVPRVLLMTGTPMQNRVENLYMLLVLLSYETTKTNGKSILDDYPTHESFCCHFSYAQKRQIKTRRGRITQVVYRGLRNEKELWTYLDKKFIRKVQEDVLDLPPMHNIDVMVSYKDDKKLLAEFEKFSENKNVDVKIKVKSAVLKAPFTAKYALDLIGSRGCVAIYSAHRDSAKIIYEKLIAAGVKAAYIDGDTPIEKRQQTVEDFQAGKLDAIVATIGAASTGITLTRAADLILNDKDWVPGNNWQAIKRIHRLTQTRSCNIHHMYGSPQDQYIGEKLIEKIKDIALVIDRKEIT